MTQETKKNIYQRIRDVIAEKIYIKRGSAGQGTGVLYDEVISAITPHLINHGIVFNTEKVGEARSRKNANDNYIYECDFNVHYINVDNPSDRFTALVEAHAMDSGDKAPGKAITYATKISLLKVFQIETGVNDESREEVREKSKVIDEDQIKELRKYCYTETGELTKIGEKLLKTYNIASLEQLIKANYEPSLKRCKTAWELMNASN